MTGQSLLIMRVLAKLMALSVSPRLHLLRESQFCFAHHKLVTLQAVIVTLAV